MHNNQQAPQSTLEPQPDYEALFSARLMQLEHNIMAKVQTMIERAIETCIRTVMERLTLNGALSFGGVATTSTVSTPTDAVYSCAAWLSSSIAVMTEVAVGMTGETSRP
ncbi:hypothetical protein HPB50_006231 [Hyalomma asiaticum]|uniref:Uncharacterized protein n=1 Tax=Hyalomma asiaticum TaxID=266040 RepID=A0ACB7SCM7_HYAAI|nr:hypothetical protein HPB50_006231 [Hyalomma asiaticum]